MADGSSIKFDDEEEEDKHEDNNATQIFFASAQCVNWLFWTQSIAINDCGQNRPHFRHTYSRNILDCIQLSNPSICLLDAGVIAMVLMKWKN